MYGTHGEGHLNSRIREIAAEALSPEQTQALESLLSGPRGRVPTPYKVWLHSPKLAGPMGQLGTFLVTDSSLSELEVVLAVLIVARHWRSDYVFAQNARTARRLGLADAAIAAIEAGQTPALDNARLQAIHDTVKAAERAEPASDETFARIVETVGRDGLAELLALIGYYSAVAVAMRLHRVPLPT